MSQESNRNKVAEQFSSEYYTKERVTGRYDRIPEEVKGQIELAFAATDINGLTQAFNVAESMFDEDPKSVENFGKIVSTYLDSMDETNTNQYFSQQERQQQLKLEARKLVDKIQDLLMADAIIA